MMKHMRKRDLDFLVNDIPGVIAFLNQADTPTETRIAYNTWLPLAKTNDSNDRVIAQDEYDQWLKVHLYFKKKPGVS